MLYSELHALYALQQYLCLSVSQLLDTKTSILIE